MKRQPAHDMTKKLLPLLPLLALSACSIDPENDAKPLTHTDSVPLAYNEILNRDASRSQFNPFEELTIGIDVLDCGGGKFELYSSFNGRVIYGFNFVAGSGTGADVSSRIDAMTDRLGRVDSGIAESVKASALQFKDGTQLVDATIDNQGFSSILKPPASCALKGLAVLVGERFLVDATIWPNLSLDAQAAAYVQAGLFKESLVHGHSDGKLADYLTGWLMTNRADLALTSEQARDVYVQWADVGMVSGGYYSYNSRAAFLKTPAGTSPYAAQSACREKGFRLAGTDDEYWHYQLNKDATYQDSDLKRLLQDKPIVASFSGYYMEIETEQDWDYESWDSEPLGKSAVDDPTYVTVCRSDLPAGARFPRKVTHEITNLPISLDNKIQLTVPGTKDFRQIQGVALNLDLEEMNIYDHYFSEVVIKISHNGKIVTLPYFMLENNRTGLREFGATGFPIPELDAFRGPNSGSNWTIQVYNYGYEMLTIHAIALDLYGN